MRKVLVLILLVLLIYPVNGVRHEIYSKASSSDEGIYLYFSELLKGAGKCLDKFLDENTSAVNLSISLYHKVKLTEEESRFYTAKGVKSNTSMVVKPFLLQSSGIKRLTKSQSIFLENFKLLRENKNNYSAYVSARMAVMNMKLAADEINNSINEIEQIELWNGTSKLYFDVSELKSKLKDVYDLIAYYESLLAGFELESPIRESLIIAVSDDHPFLYQEITIYVYAKNVTPTFLFIDNAKYEIKEVNKHSFGVLGEHIIYAEGISNGEVIKSNIVRVYVSKIPTYLVLSSKSVAFLKEKVEVTGFLTDYYGNPLQANVTVKIDDKEAELMTHNGFLSFNVTKTSEGFIKVSTFYAGNETHEGSNASISIFFSRFPTSLYIEADKIRIGVNETVNFTGKVYGVNYSIPIYMFVNSTYVKSSNAVGEFNFSLEFSKPGEYVVFAFFPGDLLYKPAKSNEIKIIVESGVAEGFGIQEMIEMVMNKISNLISNLYHFLLIIVVVVVLFLVYVKSRRKRIGSKTELVEGVGGVEEVEKVEEPKHVEEPKVDWEEEGVEKAEEVSDEFKLPKSVEEAYKILFNTLVSKYNLKKSLTPRELLKTLKNERFSEILRVVTEIHEKAVYGKTVLGDEEKNIYFRSITRILEEVE
jgi:hypothetical protein